MFTFKALKPARKMWETSGKTTLKRSTTRLWLEVLEDRTLPSASPTDLQPNNSTASSQAASAAAAITSYLFTMMQQRIATFEQDWSNALYVVGQVITQEVAAFQEQVDSFFGINLGGSGSGSGAATTAHNDPSPSLGSATPQSSGSGSGMGMGGGSCTYYNRVVEFDQYQPVDVSEEAGMCTLNSVTIGVKVVNPNSMCPQISVDYSTQDGSATAGTDYTAVNGTLYFSPGQTSDDYFSVPILDDGGDESVGSQTFYVNLSNPQNAILGSPSQVTVNVEEAGTPQGSTDTLVWNPCPNNYASNPLNWYDQTLGRQLQDGDPGPTPYSTIVFDGTPNSQTSQNAPITWDSDATIGTMEINNGYDSEQTLTTDVEMTGGGTGTSLSMDANPDDLLYLYFNPGMTIKADQGETIKNMTLAGSPTGTYEIAGGTTSMAGSPGFTERTGVNITIDKGATLSDLSYNSLQFTNSGLAINVYGTMNVEYGTGNGLTLVDNNGYQNNYINVNGGTLQYLGAGGRADTFTVPVSVTNGGTFYLGIDSGAQNDNGKLIVQNLSGYAFPNGLKNSVYMDGGASSVQLAKGDTLQCDNDYYQANGTLETMDTSTCTLQDGPNGALGTATIAGGNLAVAVAMQPAYGQLTVNCNTLSFNGTYYVAINGQSGAQGNYDWINVNGTTSLGAKSSVTVTINNAPPVNGTSWPIIQDAPNNNIQLPAGQPNFQMPIKSNPQTNLNGGVNPNKQYQYVISF